MPIATSFVQVLRRPLESALAAPVAMVHEPTAMDGPPVMEGLLERVEHEAGMSCPADPPAHDPSRVGIDHEGDVNEAGPGRDVGEVRDHSTFGRGARNWRFSDPAGTVRTCR